MGDDTCNNDEEESFGRHSIHLAALEGNTTALEAILASEPSTLELRDRDHCTPLQCAILADKPDSVRLLLNKGADPTVKGGMFSGNGGTTDDNDAITMAAVFGRMRSLHTLLNSGLQVPVSALLKAAAMNRSETIRLITSKLLTSRRDFSNWCRTDGIRQALARAAMCWHVEALQFFLHEVQDFPRKENEKDCAALQEALLRALEDNLCDELCRNKHSRQKQFIVVKEPVAAGGDLSKYSIWCALNPLHHSGHHEIARKLGIFMFAQGVDISVMDNKGRTPLAAAAGDGDDNSAFVSTLLAAGAAASMDDEDNTPLHYVRQPSILKLLLDNGANVASRNSIGWTPLISVTGTKNFYPQIRPDNRIEVCRLLLSWVAEINACARDGLTALHRAVSAKDTAVAKFLLENGADITLVTEKGESALHCACKLAASESQSWSSSVSERLNAVSLELLPLLLDHGANPEAQDTKGRTPLFYTLKGYTTKENVQQAGDWAVDASFDDAAEGSVRKESYSVAVEACDLMIRQGANAHAQEKDGHVFRSLINRKWLLRPVADLHPEAPVSPRPCSGGIDKKNCVS